MVVALLRVGLAGRDKRPPPNLVHHRLQGRPSNAPSKRPGLLFGLDYEDHQSDQSSCRGLGGLARVWRLPTWTCSMINAKTKKKTASKKAPKTSRRTDAPKAPADARANVRAQRAETASANARTTDVPSPAHSAAPLLDSRLPAVGTTLVKRDRRGAVRCECTIEADGIRYAGTLYPSLSAAASAAAKHLGLRAAVNGFSFFQIIKANRPAMSPSERLRRIGERYEERAREYLATMTAETDEALHAELEKHVTTVRRLFEKHASLT